MKAPTRTAMVEGTQLLWKGSTPMALRTSKISLATDAAAMKVSNDWAVMGTGVVAGSPGAALLAGALNSSIRRLRIPFSG